MDVGAANIGGQMLDREVRVPPHHRCRLPAAQLLKDMKRRSALHMPRCPRMAQIMPAEILDTGALERLLLGFR